MADPEKEVKPLITCPHCGQKVERYTKRCPNCGQYLPRAKREKWWDISKLTPVEIFLLILGSLMLLIGLVAI